MQIDININGQDRHLEIHPGTLLLQLLRDQGLHSVKYSDEMGDSGCDAVLVDGKLINSAIYLAAQAHRREILTVEAFGTPDNLHPIQEAFIETGAIQCGYCTPAMILATYELLTENPEPTESDVRESLSVILCRCTGYAKPVEAILLAAKRMREGSQNGLPSRRQENPSHRRDKVSMR
jgi:aerobic-type carbon monoxide dehydrogenase small subunit (CoxS/CutS family)